MIDLQKYAQLLDKYLNKQTTYYESLLTKLYKQLISNVLNEVGTIYQKYEKDGVLKREDIARYNRLDNFKRALVLHINTMSKNKKKLLEKHLSDSYSYSYDWMSWAIQKETAVRYQTTLTKEQQRKRALENQIAKLTLKYTLQQQRKRIIQQINQEIERGLTRGSTYKQMADKLATTLDNDRVKAIRTVRTETHRIKEEATHESAKEANANGIVMHKKWVNMHDEKVRSSHNVLGGQKIPVSSRFEFAGFTALTPGGFGVAHLDINCRCILVYTVERIVAQTDEQVAKRTFEQYRNLGGII